MDDAIVEVCRDCVEGWHAVAPDLFDVEQLTGGLTNRMFVVTCREAVEPEKVVVRVHPKPNCVSLPVAAPSDAGLPAADKVAIAPRLDAVSGAYSLLASPQSVFIDRQLEAAVLDAVSVAGIAPRVWGHGKMSSWYFLPPGEVEGGTGESPEAASTDDLLLRVEEWVPGPTLLATQLSNASIYTGIAIVLGKLHQIPVTDLLPHAKRASDRPITCLERVMRLCVWLCELACTVGPDSSALESKERHRKGDILCPDDAQPIPAPAVTRFARAVTAIRRFLDEFAIAAEVEWMLDEAVTSGSPLLLTHNDAQPGNWLIPSASPAHGIGHPAGLALIDYEYAGLNYRGFEFGNLFCEFTFDYHHKEAPYFKHQPSLYPSRGIQIEFFTAYLRVCNPSSTPDDNVLDSLIREADLFAMASHLHWALWSLPMALSDMAGKFGYMEYGRSRMEEYLRLKALRT